MTLRSLLIGMACGLLCVVTIITAIRVIPHSIPIEVQVGPYLYQRSEPDEYRTSRYPVRSLPAELEQRFSAFLGNHANGWHVVGHVAADKVVRIESHHLFLIADSSGWALLRFRGTHGTDGSQMLKRDIDIDELLSIVDEAERIHGATAETQLGA